MAAPAGTVTRFKRFDPSTIRDYASILFAGGKRSGKSTIMREFMWYIKDRVYDAHVFTGTFDEDHPWEWNTPKQMVHDCMTTFDKEGLDEVLATQEHRKSLARQMNASCPPSVLVLEDLEFLKPSIWVNQGTRALIFNGRWVKLFCFVAYQYVMEVKMEMRGSFDYCVFTMDNSQAVRERIWKQFAGVFKSLPEFEEAFMALTTDYRAMVLDMRARSYKLEDCVFWYRANPNLGAFKMGHPDIWIPRPPASTSATEAGSMVAARAAAQQRFVLLDDKPKKRKAPARKPRSKKQ